MPKRSQPVQTIIDECLIHAEELPVKRRASLYLGLAEICADTQEAAHFRGLASQLEQLDRSAREFAFDLSMKKERQ